MWLICGLGNPENKYKNTRHNIGFDLADSLKDFYNFNTLKEDKNIILYRGIIDQNECLLCKPQTYMNLSGPPIGKILNFYKIPKTKLLIIHDDLDLEISKVKIKSGGGNGGHNGLLSVDETIGRNYNRLRIGIGHPGIKEKVPSYVLEKFTKKDRELIDKKITLITNNFTLFFKNSGLFLNKVSN